MRTIASLAIVLLVIGSGLAHGIPGCEISNTGSDQGIATISATTSKGYSAPGGVGAVGFRIPVECSSGSVGYHVWRVDPSVSSSPTTYDIGLYCVSGDCATGGFGNALYVHTGKTYGRWFTNNRVAATVSNITVSGNGSILTITGSFLLPDFPIGGKITLSNCVSFDGVFYVSTASTTTITVASSATGSRSGCTVVSAATFPPSFPSSTVCTNSSMGEPCQEALPWIWDSTTVCKAVPCMLPAGLYAAAIGTTCTDAMYPTTGCAQLLGDADLGLIYPFTASTNLDASSALPATMSFTVNNTTAVWNTTQGSSAPIKPVKLLIY
jgi:hypothetical protein